MSKIQLQKELQKNTKEQLIEQITELYDSFKPVKEYYENFLNPENVRKLFDKYKLIIVKKFNPNNISRNLRTCFPVAKKAISDFSALKPPPKLVADLMVTLAENACNLSDSWGDMPEHHYTNTENWFEKTLKYLKKEGLLADFKPRCKKCLKNAMECGGGFSDSIDCVYHDYYQ